MNLTLSFAILFQWLPDLVVQIKVYVRPYLVHQNLIENIRASPKRPHLAKGESTPSGDWRRSILIFLALNHGSGNRVSVFHWTLWSVVLWGPTCMTACTLRGQLALAQHLYLRYVN